MLRDQKSGRETPNQRAWTRNTEAGNMEEQSRANNHGRENQNLEIFGRDIQIDVDFNARNLDDKLKRTKDELRSLSFGGETPKQETRKQKQEQIVWKIKHPLTAGAALVALWPKPNHEYGAATREYIHFVLNARLLFLLNARFFV